MVDSCLAYVSPFGHIYVDVPYQQGMTATHSFDAAAGAVVYELSYNGGAIASIPFIMESLLNE
jgi:hypothetical protein